MNQHIDLILGDIEQPAGLDDLEGLVHHGCRIDCNLGSHLPRRMCQGIFDADLFELFRGPFTKRTSAGCQDDALQFAPLLTFESLENGTMFAIDRHDTATLAGRQLRHRSTCHNQRFLVGQCHSLA